MSDIALANLRLELALEAAGLDLWENDLLTGAVPRKASKVFAELGYSAAESANYVDDIFALIYPDDVERVKAAIKQHLDGETAQYRCEFRLRAKHGAWLWYANYGKVMDEERSGRRFIGVTFNIDDRKRKEHTLMVQERELRTLIEHSPDAMARYDRDLCRVYVNPDFVALADGVTAARLGQSLAGAVVLEQSGDYAEALRGVFASGQDAHLEIKWAGKGGAAMCSDVRMTAERDLSGALVSVLMVARDITELNEYRNELKRKDIAKTHFLAAASHDLRQPLAATSLLIDALRLSQPSVMQQQIIQNLELNMVNFNALIDSLLSITKLESGKISAQYAQVKVSELFRWLEQTFTPQVMAQQLRFKFYFPLRQELCFVADLELVKSALANLLTNAIKFTPRGGILVSARRRGDQVVLQVWDSGMGIGQEHLGHIFEEFYQIGNPHREHRHGHGLGLAIARRALAVMGVKMTCHSRVGRGSVFGFCLPATCADPLSADEPQSVATVPLGHYGAGMV